MPALARTTSIAAFVASTVFAQPLGRFVLPSHTADCDRCGTHVGALRAGPGDSLASRQIGAWGVDLSDRDPTVRPGDDFYKSQNGAWLARTELGAHRPAAAYWADLRRLAPRRINAMLKEISENSHARPGSRDAQVRTLYRSFMDTAAVDAKGLSVLEPELTAIQAVSSPAQLAALFGRMAGPGTPRTMNANTGYSIGREGPFSLDIDQNHLDPSRYVVHVGLSGLNLPPVYYVDSTVADVKRRYVDYIAQTLTAAGRANGAADATAIVEMETRLARARAGRDDAPEADQSYSVMSVAELRRRAPAFDWDSFFAAAGLHSVSKVAIDRPEAFVRFAAEVSRTPIAVWQARQTFAIIDDAASASYIGEPAYLASFGFRVRDFNNPSAVPNPRASRVANTVTRNLGGSVSALYLERYSSPAVRAAASAMASNLKAAFLSRIAAVPWLSAAAKQEARHKVERLTIAIGGPPHLDTYEGLDLREDDLYGNAMRAAAYEWTRRLGRLGMPFDRGQWQQMTPEYPNYNYNRESNTVEVPAAMLEPPFFDPHADAAVNYGALGAQIAAMLVSAIDDARGFDADGRLREWWTAADGSAHDRMTRRLAAQYTAIEPLPGIHVKGDLLAAEAIEDLGGMQIALDAYHRSLHGNPAPVIDGFTGDQRFFLGRAQMWRAKFDPAFVRNQLATAHNAQPFLRVNGPVRNMDAWYAAFSIAPSDPMYLAPEQRVRIW